MAQVASYPARTETRNFTQGGEEAVNETGEDAMKKALMAMFFVITAVLGSVAFAYAGETPTLKVNIPFAFHAGNQVFPAGEYIIKMSALGHSATGSILTIGTKDGSVLMCLNANASETSGSDPAYTATFKKYGGRYFLSEVQNGWRMSGLPKTRAEKELAIAEAGNTGRSDGKDVVVTSSTPQ